MTCIPCSYDDHHLCLFKMYGSDCDCECIDGNEDSDDEE